MMFSCDMRSKYFVKYGIENKKFRNFAACEYLNAGEDAGERLYSCFFILEKAIIILGFKDTFQ